MNLMNLTDSTNLQKKLSKMFEAAELRCLSKKMKNPLSWIIFEYEWTSQSKTWILTLLYKALAFKDFIHRWPTLWRLISLWLSVSAIIWCLWWRGRVSWSHGSVSGDCWLWSHWVRWCWSYKTRCNCNSTHWDLVWSQTLTGAIYQQQKQSLHGTRSNQSRREGPGMGTQEGWTHVSRH